MASTTLLAIALALAIHAEGSLGNGISCEYLTEESCAYAVSSTGKRCLLEKSLTARGEYTCRSSEIVADKLSDWIETDECIAACGVERKALGISSDSLLDRGFAGSLCSVECYRNCPNIVDLYFNLAAGEGVYLPTFCEARQSNRRREMEEIASSGLFNVDGVTDDVDGDLALSPAEALALAPGPDLANLNYLTNILLGF